MSNKIRLSAMMFLQYAIWGAWAPVLSEYLITKLGFSGTEVGVIYALLPLATIISPFIGGQAADRYFPTQKVIAFLQLFGGLMLIYMSFVTNYTALVWLMLIYSILYAPTLALTNSIAFINLKDSEKEFGIVRVWGTIGWIVAGLMLAGWRMLGENMETIALRGDTLMLAGIFSLIMGIQAFGLPHTPPRKESKKPWAFLEAIKMLKNKNLAIFVGITFIVATELQFYYILTAPFLTSGVIGVDRSMISGVMVIAQIAEIFVMALLLPYFLPKFGIKKTMIIGVLAWPARYIIFVIAQPVWLVIASLALHGFCYVFFFTAAFIYIDKVSPPDIRASAQSMIAIVTLGLGNFLGSLFVGWIQTMFTGPEGTDWRSVFIIPAILTIICAAAFILLFKERKKPIKVDVDEEAA
jgi:nucleoside transporter